MGPSPAASAAPAGPASAGGEPRFGVLMAPPLTSGSVVETARRVEELGYDAFFLPDHFNEVISPVPALAAAAVATSLRIGSYMLVNDLRHPAMVARDFAALDEISEGRAELGIGAGWWPADYRAVGLEMDRAPDRISRLREAVSLIRSCWTDEEVDHEGRWYRTRLIPQVRPVQQPHPPIMVGGGGPRILRAAAEMADVVSIGISLPSGRRADVHAAAGRATFDEVAQKVQTAREQTARVEAQRARLVDMLLLRVVVDENSERAVDRVAAMHGLSPEQVRRSPYLQVGTASEVAGGLEGLAAAGVGSFVVRVADMESGAQVRAEMRSRRRGR